MHLKRRGAAALLTMAMAGPALAGDPCPSARGASNHDRNRRALCLAIRDQSETRCSFILGDTPLRMRCIAILTGDDATCSRIDNDANRAACVEGARITAARNAGAGR